MWALYTIFECYQAYCKKYNFRYVIDGRDTGAITQVLTDYDKKNLSFVHVMLVQGNVIEAVKHSEGGSQAFKKYYLDGMTAKENIDYVRKELTLPINKGGYGLSMEDANKMLFIVEWAKQTKLLVAVKNFITKYNKGKLPKDPSALEQWEDFIQANTYFGHMMKPIFDIKKHIDFLTEEALKDIEESTQNFSLDNTFDQLFGNTTTVAKSSAVDTDFEAFFASLPR